jgi:hypothetical protein
VQVLGTLDGELDWEKTFNTQINKICYVIEQIIANFKTGGSCTPTTGDHSTRSPRRSQPLSAYISIERRE